MFMLLCREIDTSAANRRGGTDTKELRYRIRYLSLGYDDDQWDEWKMSVKVNDIVTRSL